MKGLRYMMIFPLLMMLASIVFGCQCYNEAKYEMRLQLNQALQHLVLDQSGQQYLMDSIASLHAGEILTINDRETHLQRSLSMVPLRDTCHISVCLNDATRSQLFSERATVCSDTLLWCAQPDGAGEVVVALKAFANPSFCAVLGHSKQRVPITGFLLGLFMLAMMSIRQRKMQVLSEIVCPIEPMPAAKIHLTPMQKQLMDLFAAAPNHTLSKEEICAALWPKKDDPDDTLYTFISRLKSSLKRQSTCRIINERGEAYTLVSQDEMA